MIAGRNPAIDVAIITNAIPTKKEKGRKQKGKAIETDLQKKESEDWRTSHILRILAG